MRTNQLSHNNSGGLGMFSLVAKAVARPAPEAETAERRDTLAQQATATAPSPRRGLIDRLDHWFWTRQQRDLEAYLAKATDVYDLEARIRALERRVPHPYY